MDRFGRRSLQVGGHLFDAGLGTSLVLIAARRTGHADRTDRLIADLDRQRALRRNDVGETERAGERIALDAVGKFAGRPCKGARRVGLLHGVLERSEAGAVVAHAEHQLALAAEHARPQASAEATETPAIWNAILDMGMHLPGECRCSRGVLPIIGYCVGFASAFPRFRS